MPASYCAYAYATAFFLPEKTYNKDLEVTETYSFLHPNSVLGVASKPNFSKSQMFYSIISGANEGGNFKTKRGEPSRPSDI